MTLCKKGFDPAQVLDCLSERPFTLFMVCFLWSPQTYVLIQVFFEIQAVPTIYAKLIRVLEEQPDAKKRWEGGFQKLRS